MQRGILVAGTVAILLSALYLVMAFSFSRGTPAKPGPGLYPLLLGFLLVISSLGFTLNAILKPTTAALEWPRGPALRRVVMVFAASLSFLLLFPFVGYIPAAAVVVLLTLYGMKMPRWPVVVGLAVAITLGTYYLFVIVLSVPIHGLRWFD